MKSGPMHTSRFTCRRKFRIRRGNGVASTALVLICGLVCNVWTTAAPARRPVHTRHDAPVLTQSTVPQVFAAVLEESGKLKYVARAFRRLNPRLKPSAAVKPFRSSPAGDGPVISQGIGPFFQAANQLVFLRVDLPPPLISAHL
jgi:hypothetical protein